MTKTSRRVSDTRAIPSWTDPDQHALTIAETATDAWHRHPGPGDLDVPLSTVAALALLTPPAAERDGVAQEWISLSPHAFAHRVRGLWNWVMITRPDLVNPVWPLMSVWHSKNRPLSDSNLAAAKQVADAVLRAGLIGLTGTDLRFEADLLGAVLTLLRPKKAWQARGQYYTSPAVADTIAGCLLVADLAPLVEEGQAVNDPTCGTGGMIRAAAQRMRAAGRDPRKSGWSGCDIDPMAIACFAVNAIIWDLGPNVVAACGDTLAWDGFYERAIAARKEMLELTRGLVRDRVILDLLRGIDTRVAQVANERHGSPSAGRAPAQPRRGSASVARQRKDGRDAANGAL